MKDIVTHYGVFSQNKYSIMSKMRKLADDLLFFQFKEITEGFTGYRWSGNKQRDRLPTDHPFRLMPADPGLQPVRFPPKERKYALL
jgi:hypothetical protein